MARTIATADESACRGRVPPQRMQPRGSVPPLRRGRGSGVCSWAPHLIRVGSPSALAA